MKIYPLNIHEHDITCVAILIYETDRGLFELLFGKQKDKALRQIKSLIIQEENSFNYHNITIAMANTEIQGILVSYAGEQVDTKKESNEVWNTLGMTSALRLAIIDKIFLQPLLTTKLSAQDFYISNLCVHEAARGKGVGTALIHHAKKIAQKKGCSLVHLDVSDENKNAIRLYRTLGFTIDATRSMRFFKKVFTIHSMKLNI